MASKPAAPPVPAIKRILITHASPADENSPYHHLAKSRHLKIDFQSFVEIAGIATPEFRKQNIHPLEYTAVIFTSKHAVDHFFRICKDLRVEMPAECKYFCVSDATAKYLQKYIIIRKRRLYVGERSTADLIPIVKKHANEKFLYPCGDKSTSQTDLTEFMHQNAYALKEAMVFHSVACDLSKLKLDSYDMICFFSPGTIQALKQGVPGFSQNGTLIAVFGKTTAKAAEVAGMRVDIEVPKPDMPSMTMAIEHYLRG
jgi:uroporphyrinogen-III synthase